MVSRVLFVKILGIMWRQVLGRRFKRTSLVFLVALCFLIGVGIARTAFLIGWDWSLLAGGFALFSLRKRTLWTLLWVAIFGLSLGLWRGSDYMVKLADFQTLYGQKITITAHAMNDAVYGKNSQMTFDVNDAKVKSTGQKLTGKISLSGFGLPAVFQGDEVEVTGKLSPSLGSYQARMSYGSMKLVGSHPSLIGDIRRHFAAGMQTALPEPVASFGMGLLIGQRNTLPADVTQILLIVGLTHIIAVSGYNLTILLRASRRLLGKRSKRQVLLLSILLIGVFLLLTGSSASIVRAAIVSLLSILTAYYGREMKPLVILLLAAAITGFANPYYVWTDSSWYLSFLAFFGVMVLAPMVQTRIPKRLVGSLVFMVALESLCAEVMTMPYVLYVFGQVSFIGLVANVFIAALVPLAMLLSVIAGIAGMISPLLSGWFAWPARYLMSYMLDLADILSRLPHIFMRDLKFTLIQLLIMYVVVGFLCVVLWRKTGNTKPGTITDIATTPQLVSPAKARLN